MYIVTHAGVTLCNYLRSSVSMPRLGLYNMLPLKHSRICLPCAYLADDLQNELTRRVLYLWLNNIEVFSCLQLFANVPSETTQ